MRKDRSSRNGYRFLLMMLMASTLLGWCYVSTRGMVPGCSAGVPPGSEMSPALGVAITRSRAIKVLLHFLQIIYSFAMAKWLCALLFTSLLMLKGSPKPCLG